MKSEEWEKLKNAELAKQKAQEKLLKVSQIKDSSEPVNQTKLHQPERDYQVRNTGPMISLESPQIQQVEPSSIQQVAKKKSDPSESFNLPPERSRSETKRASNIKKLLGLGTVLVLGLTVFLFLNKNESDLNLDRNTPIPSVSVEPTIDEGPVSTQSLTEEAIVSTQPESQTQSTRPTLTLPLALPPTKSVPNSSITSQSALLNPSFEDTEGWVLKIGDDHILGKYSGNWASTGSQSYQISLFGNRVYEYCFTPGMRTSVNQTVDLSGVNEILFDINILHLQ